MNKTLLVGSFVASTGLFLIIGLGVIIWTGVEGFADPVSISVGGIFLAFALAQGLLIAVCLKKHGLNKKDVDDDDHAIALKERKSPAATSDKAMIVREEGATGGVNVYKGETEKAARL